MIRQFGNLDALTEKRLLGLILILFVLLGVGYAFVTPVFEASDELWHYPMVRHLADGNPLPVQVFNPDAAGPWKQEASQPPLYYYIGAALTFWIDTSDMESVRWLNPHVDNGVIKADKNANLVIHDPDADIWRGTQLAVLVVRLFSVLLGATTVYLTYRIAQEVAPGRPEIALGAAAVNAFTPMFLFISGAVNNDNLVILLASLALLLMIRYVRVDEKSARQRYLYLLVLGTVIGLGSLTKMSALGLFPLAALAIFIERWRNLGRGVDLRSLGRVIWQSAIHFFVLFAPALLIAGWWYYRNVQLYGDWSGWNAFIAVLGQRAHPASLAQLWDERWGFMLSYWGLFGGLNVPMPEWIYHLLNTLVIISAVGFLVYFVRLVVKWHSNSGIPISNLQSLIFNILDFVERNAALILCLLWGAAVVVGLVRWATVTWSSQGRLVFSSISVFSTLFVIGLVGWLPWRSARAAAAILGVFLFTIAALAPILWIRPAYDPKQYQNNAEIRIANVTYGDRMRLIGYAIEDKPVQPGDTIDIVLKWEALNRMDRDWSVFVHLNDPILGSPVAQRDMYLGQGLVATRLLEPGDHITNLYRVEIPATAIAPSELALTVGLYDFYTGERFRDLEGRDAVMLDTVFLQALEGEIPNPIKVNFENELELVGFNIGPRRLEVSEEAQLTLYWRPLQNLNKDYTFFAQIVDENTTRWASHDLEKPTSRWSPKDIFEVNLSLSLVDDSPPGVYPLIVGVYSRSANGGFDRLQMVTEEGRLTDDFLPLVDIRIEALE